jgi:hypothetical protein
MPRAPAAVAAFGCIAALTLVWNMPAAATTLQKQSLRQLLVHADLVFTAEVIEIDVEADADGVPWTLYRFGSLQTVVGEHPGDTFALRCMGGAIDGVATVVHGTPQYDVGDQVLAFYQGADEVCQITGWTQGSFRVVDEGARRIVVSEQGHAVVGLSSDDFVLGGRLPHWESKVADAHVVDMDHGTIKPAATPAASAAGATAADLRTVTAELRAMAASLRKRWHRAAPPSGVVGRRGAVNGRSTP